MKCKPPVLYPSFQVHRRRRCDEAVPCGPSGPSSAEEIERLRLIAESQFPAANEYRLKALSGRAHRPH